MSNSNKKVPQGNDTELLEKLREIRKKTGLSQEKFYTEHLSDVVKADRNTDSAKQGFMRDLENDYKPITPAILKRYAEIAKCSVDDLLNFDIKLTESAVTTFRDLCRMLVKLDERFRFVFDQVGTFSSCERLSNGSGDPIMETVPKNAADPVMRIGFPPRAVAYEQREGSDYDAPRYWTFATTGYVEVNCFLHRYAELKNSETKDLLSPDEWDALVEKLLARVPTDPAPLYDEVIFTLANGGNYISDGSEPIKTICKRGWQNRLFQIPR